MAAIVLALSIDYSLILLTRFREEIIIRKKGVREACIDMLYFSGMIISVGVSFHGVGPMFALIEPYDYPNTYYNIS
ncbi:hypothetical protein Pmar_PMAR022798 [Perkinsus marinus ATCC 50983]|uniref:Membrane transport protein MMPL domain-containing protein n=1 Tax=Perkinsus marinus (strain ATCC 50983 / TXsc) TaxID=423536 RepID=C5LUM5_PERM5|nr:hypothetical protein Pmar_PMAR022798 [Perkinsus marinus ATCC 50983]EEQ99566.1 hypothetical protein Pmar_PMAR022798 [Perkinsus marinus ATCC 50983]|eukprot:XP_002766849.1 hypothetical protein Pmar_PMAR022798 [Perkinsus marinus ATCC 50983]